MKMQCDLINYLIEAEAALAKTDYSSALHLYEQIIEKYPDDYHGYWGRFQAKTYKMDTTRGATYYTEEDEDYQKALSLADDADRYIIISCAAPYFQDLRRKNNDIKAKENYDKIKKNTGVIAGYFLASFVILFIAFWVWLILGGIIMLFGGKDIPLWIDTIVVWGAAIGLIIFAIKGNSSIK